MSKEILIMVIFTLLLLGCIQVALGQHQEDKSAHPSIESSGLGNNSLSDGDRSSKCTRLFRLL